jgi:hypothetical protein
LPVRELPGRHHAERDHRNGEQGHEAHAGGERERSGIELVVVLVTTAVLVGGL